MTYLQTLEMIQHFETRIIARNSTEFARLEAMLQTRKEEGRQLMDLLQQLAAEQHKLRTSVAALEHLVPRASTFLRPVVNEP